MSSTPINLGKVRKERARAADRQRADANAVKFGRTKAQKDHEKALKDKEDRALDGHKRDP